MIQNLCMYGLPFASRQNEMIEMAMTFKFTGMEVDLDEMGRRAEAMGQDFATQFVNSANIEVASFKLPVDFGAEDEVYQAAVARLESLCTIAEAIDVKRCYAVIAPGSNRLAFQENFESHRTRINEVATRLAKSNITLGLAFSAIPSDREKFEYQFVCKAEELVALINSVGHDNVGLAIDTWNWQLGDGAMDQVSELGIGKIFDVRIADLPDNYDPATITARDRVAPSENNSQFAINLIKFLAENNYDQTLSVVAFFADSNDRSRGIKSVEKIRKSLNSLLIAAGIEDAVPEESLIDQQNDYPRRDGNNEESAAKESATEESGNEKAETAEAGTSS